MLISNLSEMVNNMKVLTKSVNIMDREFVLITDTNPKYHNRTENNNTYYSMIHLISIYVQSSTNESALQGVPLWWSGLRIWRCHYSRPDTYLEISDNSKRINTTLTFQIYCGTKLIYNLIIMNRNMF